MHRKGQCRRDSDELERVGGKLVVGAERGEQVGKAEHDDGDDE